MKRDNDENITLVSYELCDLIPLWTVVTNYKETTYKILGLPVWKVKDVEDEDICTNRSRCYFLGLPVAEISYEFQNADDTIGCEEDNNKFVCKRKYYLFGLPIAKICDTNIIDEAEIEEYNPEEDEHMLIYKREYYFLGLPIAELIYGCDDENEDEVETYDFEEDIEAKWF